MNHFLVHFLAPSSVLDEWMKKPEEERKAEEGKMIEEWNVWTAAHEGMIKETKGTGKPKRITANGVEDARNDLMMYSIVEAESHEAAAKAFEGHPHFAIPGAVIEVMPLKSI